MSGSKMKAQRRNALNEGAVSKSKQAADKQRENAKFRNRALIVTAAFLVLVLVVVLLSTPILYRCTALKFGDTKFSTADYNYYYGTTYSSYYSQYAQTYGSEYASYFMPDADTLKETTLANMQAVAMLNEEAKANGFTISEDSQAAIDNSTDLLDMYAAAYGYSSRSEYLHAYYGGGVNTKVYQRNLLMSTVAQEYTAEVQNGFTYTQEDFDNWYAENADTYETITYRFVFFSGAAESEDATDEELAAAMAASEEKAEAFLALAQDVTDGESFAALAAEQTNGEETGEEHTMALGSVPANYGDWLKEESRAAGDVGLVETESGCYVMFYEGWNDNNYNTVDVRHTLIAFGSFNRDEFDSDEAYNAAVAADAENVRAEAEELYQNWLAGAADEESFAAMADEHSSDSPEGGLYEQVYKGQMVPEFEDWCFAEDRQPGDSGIVETQYGCHVMYFVGENDCYRNVLAETNLRSASFTAYQAEKTEGFEQSTNLFFKLFCNK